MLKRKDIEGFLNYQISNFGTVRKEVLSKDGIFYKRVRHCINHFGYPVVSLKNRSGKNQTVFVHGLVAKAFVSGRFKRAVVDHRDENKQNNFFKNLRWVSNRFNIARGFKRDLPTNVHKYRNGYAVRIRFCGRVVYLGLYETPGEAAIIAKKAREQAENGEKPTL